MANIEVANDTFMVLPQYFFISTFLCLILIW